MRSGETQGLGWRVGCSEWGSESGGCWLRGLVGVATRCDIGFGVAGGGDVDTIEEDFGTWARISCNDLLK